MSDALDNKELRVKRALLYQLSYAPTPSENNTSIRAAQSVEAHNSLRYDALAYVVNPAALDHPKVYLPPLKVILFWSKVIRSHNPNECWKWRWLRKATRGEARPSIAGMSAARFSYLLLRGPIPEGFWVLHECDNGECTNPAHLYVGTAQENTFDMQSRGRAWWQKPDANKRRQLRRLARGITL